MTISSGSIRTREDPDPLLTDPLRRSVKLRPLLTAPLVKLGPVIHQTRGWKPGYR